MDRLFSLSPREFEELAAHYLRSKGLKDVRVVGGAGDLGIDIRATDEHGRRVVAQCKRYREDVKVGGPEIQHFFGMVVHDAAAWGIFVTTSDFTAPARALAVQRDIELVPGSTIGRYYEGVLAEQRAKSRDITDLQWKARLVELNRQSQAELTQGD